jgi:riboflavin synthase
MFTGIIETLGKVVGVTPASLAVEATFEEPIDLGESIAVNGCCLTVVSAEGALRFDISEETLRRTSLGELKPGSLVNLERAMKVGSRFGGHIVQGHVDGTGALVSVRETDAAHVLRFSYPTEFGKYLIEKGSIAIDGISLTAVSPTGTEFEVWVIPHTWQHTNLGAMRVGQRVNLEFDMVAKYVEGLIQKERRT